MKLRILQITISILLTMEKTIIVKVNKKGVSSLIEVAAIIVILAIPFIIGAAKLENKTPAEQNKTIIVNSEEWQTNHAD